MYIFIKRTQTYAHSTHSIARCVQLQFARHCFNAVSECSTLTRISTQVRNDVIQCWFNILRKYVRHMYIGDYEMQNE